jgi:peptidylprolyl isomerase
MAHAKHGDTIVIHYKGRLEDGTVFDSSEGKNPLEFTIGEGEVIPGLEQEVIGMTAGETKIITIPMDLAYGPHMKDRIFEFDRKKLGDNVDLEIGRQLQMFRADGMPVMVTITDKNETSYFLDSNHPLAGKTLIFETQLLEIK